MIDQNSANFTPSFTPFFTPVRKSPWQHEVSQSDLPLSTKGFLLLLSVEWMDAHGGSCFPSEAQIMEKTGISRPALTGHIRRAVEGGFLEVHHYGRGIRNRRYNYQARFPGEDGKESFVSPPDDGKESFASLTMFNVNHAQESATPEPAAVEPAPVAPLSVPVLRTPSRTTLTEDWKLPDHFRDVAQEKRPDLVDRLDTIAENFRDHHLSRATKSACWIGEWRIWLRREHGPRPTQAPSKPFKTETVSSPYATWQPGEKAPLGRQEAPDEAQRMFDEHMKKLNAVKDPVTGIWRLRT